MKPQIAIGLGIAVASLLEPAYYWSSLPERMASNFAGDGQPQAWSSKTGFLSIHVAVIVFLVLVLIGVPWLIERRGPSLPEETRRRLQSTTSWYVVVFLAFEAAVMHLVLRANLDGTGLSDAFIWLLAAFMGYTLWWVIRLKRQGRPS